MSHRHLDDAGNRARCRGKLKVSFRELALTVRYFGNQSVSSVVGPRSRRPRCRMLPPAPCLFSALKTGPAFRLITPCPIRRAVMSTPPPVRRTGDDTNLPRRIIVRDASLCKGWSMITTACEF